MTVIKAPRRISVDFLIDWLLANGISRKELYDLPTLSRVPANTTTVLSLREYLDLFNEAAVLYGDDCLGLRVGSGTDPRDFGYVGLLVHYCSTLRESWQLFQRYLCTLFPEMVLRLEEGQPSSRLEYDVLSFSSDFSRQDVEMSLATLIRFFRTYAGDDWAPERVQFKHRQSGDLEPYTRVFGAEVHFDQPVSALVFASDVLDTRVSDTDPELLKIMRDHADSMLENVSRSDNVVTNVRYQIASTIGTDLCCLAIVADNMFISERTLKRQLEKFGTSFRKLKLGVVDDIARRSLAETSAAVTEIALKLGYAETASFDRVFKKLNVLTPTAYRKLARRGIARSPST
jgi:AraC-like DNA-binding protein